MNTSYSQTPGTLNLTFPRGNDFSAIVDFSIPMTGYTASASIVSAVTGEAVMPITVTDVSAAEGKFNLSLTDSQTSSLARGTYSWSMAWVEGSANRTALTGIVEVL